MADFLLALAQSGYPTDGNVLAQAERFAKRASDANAHLLAFPENFMCPRPLRAQELRDMSEPLDGPFVRAIGACARRHGLWIVFNMSEANPAGGPPFNTAVVVDDAGEVRGSYRKCHLYDAHAVRESDRMSAGSALCAPIQTPFCTLGVGICYDLRFPELSRHLALAGCDLLVIPSAWHDGPHKARHWQTLLAARAIENECYVAGICHAGSRFVGTSLVANPLGVTVAQGPAVLDPQRPEALAIARIDTQATTAARDAMPVLEHRRPGLYQL